jgi:ribose/xylose/arabinose/galactoside ABC-type transport system permease subunit
MFPQKMRAYAARAVMELILLALCIVLAFRAPHFLTAGNMLNILRTISMQGLIAFGMTMVIISGEIDLSVGSAVAFSGCLIALMVNAGMLVPVAFIITLAVGFCIGAFTGFVRGRYQVPTFITSLALLTGLRGGARLITKGFPLNPDFPDWYIFMGSGRVFDTIPFPAIMLIVTFAAVHFLMNYTSFGRSVYAVGGNPDAARLCGINVSLVRILALAITGTLAALSGIMLSARIDSGNPTVAQGWELDVISAVIIGGTSLAGGVGTVWGTLIGLIFIGVIINGMTLLNVPTDVQYVVRGLLILIAVLINRMQLKRE